MSSASLIITLSTEIHQFLSERGSECELWKTLNDNDPLPVTGYNPAYAVYFYQFEVSSHYDYQALFTVISDFVENNYKGADFEHEDDIFEFMTDNFGLRLLTDYGDNTEHEGNFKSSLSIYIDIWDVETDQGTFNIISLDEMFVKDYGYGSMTLAGGKLLLRWLTAGEKLKDCFDELVRRCMTNELARLKPSECKKVTDNALYSDKPTLTVELDITEAGRKERHADEIYLELKEMKEAHQAELDERDARIKTLCNCLVELEQKRANATAYTVRLNKKAAKSMQNLEKVLAFDPDARAKVLEALEPITKAAQKTDSKPSNDKSGCLKYARSLREKRR